MLPVPGRMLTEPGPAQAYRLHPYGAQRPLYLGFAAPTHLPAA